MFCKNSLVAYFARGESSSGYGNIVISGRITERNLIETKAVIAKEISSRYGEKNMQITILNIIKLDG